jgi:hypothetical protein
MPTYWNIALTTMQMNVELPFVTDLWLTHFTHGTANMSILSCLTIMGSTFGTSTYKLYNQGKAPYSEADIAVLRTVKEPELFLYTWNTHPSTNAMADKALQTHRLGLYDWIPRAHSVILAVMQKLAFDIPFIMLADGVPDVAKPNAYTKPAQILGTISNIMGRMGGYPFTQLSTNDPAAIAKSQANPDPRFLGWWTFWIIEDIVRVVRPYTPFETGIGVGGGGGCGGSECDQG